MYRASLNLPVTMQICGLIATATQSIPNNVGTQVTYGALAFPTQGTLVPSLGSSSIIITDPGLYRIVSMGSLGNGTSGTRRMTNIFVNANEVARVEATTSNLWSMGHATTILLAAGDVITARLFHTSGAALSTVASQPPSLTVYRAA